MCNQKILRQLMRDYGLTQKSTAKLMELSEATIRSWLKPVTSKNHRNMPDREVTFIKCLLRPKQKNPL